MKRTIQTWTLFVALAGTSAVAQVPPAQAPGAPDEKTRDATAAEADMPTIPERELTFDVSEEAAKVFIDPQALVSNTNLQQLRYVARVDLYVSDSPASESGGGTRYKAFKRLFPTAPMELDKLAADLPKQHHLPEDLLAELLAQGRYLTSRSEWPESAKSMMEVIQNKSFTFEVLAPTAERAKELSHGMLALLDYGFYRPEHQALLRELKQYEKELAEWRAKLTPMDAGVEKLEEELKRLDEYNDIDAELLRSLITQQRLIAVDLAGVTARLEACAELLGQTQPSPKRDVVEGLKVTAEIELVGLTAKKSTVGAIVKAATARRDTLKRLSDLRTSRLHASRAVEGCEQTIEKLQTAIEISEPPVVKGDVTIRRIEWDSKAGTGRLRPPGSVKPWWLE